MYFHLQKNLFKNVSPEQNHILKTEELFDQNVSSL